MRTILLAATLAALGACQPASEKAPGGKEQPEVARHYIAEVEALPAARQRALFFRAIRDAGFACQTVTAAEKLASPGKAPTWLAHCEDGSAHLVAIADDGTANVTSRAPR